MKGSLDQSLSPFDYAPRTRLVFGLNSVERVGELACELSAKRVLVVTDAGLVAAGHAQRVEHLLQAAGLGVVVFDQVCENPTTRCVDQCLKVAQASGIDLILGLGGGSSLDTAKACNFLLTNGGRMQDYWGVGKATKPMLPLLAVPTTAGTGSECQCAALIADDRTHQKMACLDPKAAARVAILDPALTLSQPPRVTACTGIDALTHAVETAVTRKRNALSLMFSHQGFQLVVSSLPGVLNQPTDLGARSRMQLGASLAGAAIEHSMLGAAHAAANPLTAHYGIVHGQAVGLMLPGVMRFNAAEAKVRSAYAELAVVAGLAGRDEDSSSAFAGLVARIEWLLNQAGLPRSLGDCGVKHASISHLAEEAARQWTAGFNPRAVTAADFVKLYEAAFEPRSDGEEKM
jgi:alcohol dehydrogenase